MMYSRLTCLLFHFNFVIDMYISFYLQYVIKRVDIHNASQREQKAALQEVMVNCKTYFSLSSDN